MMEDRTFNFEVTFNLSEILSESDVRTILGYSYEKLSDADWEEAAYQWIWEKLAGVGSCFNNSFEVVDVKVHEY